MPQITHPTRVSKTTAALTGNIFINNFEHKYLSGNVKTSISDHRLQFTTTENAKDKKRSTKLTIQSSRDFRHFNKDLFNADIKNQDWTLATENNDINLAFRTFLHLFNKT